MTGDEPSPRTEHRDYLQARLVVFYRLVFFVYLPLFAMNAFYAKYPEIKPRYADTSTVVSVIALVAVGSIWRGLVRYRLSVTALHTIEIVAGVLNGVQLASAAFFNSELHLAAPAVVVYAYWWVFARALIVPSSGRWTGIVSSAVFVPVVAAAAGLAITIPQEVPPLVYVFGAVTWCAVAVVLSATGSRILYGLRRQIRKAMQLGQYTLDRKIGEGGMGAVYLAHHALLRRPTAIKLVQPGHVGKEALARFEREVQHMSQLTHSNSVAVYDYGRSADGVFYYAMEYLGGGIDLEQLVRARGPLPQARVLRILAQVCGALQEAHNRGLVHRDIKPANIILCERGDEPDVAKVVDYGLVKEISGDVGASGQVVLGTPAYLAPEVITDPVAVGPSADLYALGAVGFFLLTGHRVFEGKTAVDVCIQHVSAAPPPPSSVSSQSIAADLDALILRCLAKRPADRPGSAAELAELFAALPATGWSTADARAWWSSYRASLAVPSATAPTVTLTIDLERGQS